MADFRVAIGGIFPVESIIATRSTTTTKFGVETGSLFAVDSGVAAGSMVYTSLPLLKVMALMFSLGLISA